MEEVEEKDYIEALFQEIQNEELPEKRLKQVVCEVELSEFDNDKKDTVISFLEKYIKENYLRESEITPVGAAIRKYMAMVAGTAGEDFSKKETCETIDRLSWLLREEEMCLWLQVEAVKMVYRIFEFHSKNLPKNTNCCFPSLESCLIGMIRAYGRSRLLEIKELPFGTISAMAISSLILMKSRQSYEALRIMFEYPREWIQHAVRKDIEEHGHILPDKETMKRLEEIPGSDGWWKNDGRDCFVEYYKELHEKGYSKEEAIDFLESVYSCVAAEFGC